MSSRRPRRYGYRWTRKELLALLYLRTQNLSSESDSRIAQMAEAVERTADAIINQNFAFDSCDPNMSGGAIPSRAIEEIWAEYERNPQRTLDKGREAYESILGISG